MKDDPARETTPREPATPARFNRGRRPALMRIPNLRRSERATLRFSFLGEIGRGFFTALATDFALLVAIEHFGVGNRFLIWLLSSATFAGMLVTVFGTTLTGHHRKKSVVFGVEVISRLLLLVAAFSVNGPMFVVIMAFSLAVNALSVPLVVGIYGANFRQSVRGRSVGRLQATTVFSVSATGYIAGQILEVDTDYFRYLQAGVSLLSLGCAWMAYQIPEARPRAKANRSTVLRDLLRIATRDRTFMYLELIWFIFGFSNLWLLPIRVLRLTDIGFTPQQVMVATTVILFIAQVLSVGFWGRIVYRMNFAVYRIVVNSIFVVGILIYFHAGSFGLVMVGGALWGIALGGGGLAWRLLVTFFAEPARMSRYMSVHTFFVGIRGLMAPYLSLTLYDHFGATLVAKISALGFGLSVLMLIPIIPVMRKRGHAMRKGTIGMTTETPPDSVD